MGYTAKEIVTNITYYSKGANKLSVKIGCNASTITKFFKIKGNFKLDKVIKGFIVSKTIDLVNENRGSKVKIRF